MITEFAINLLFLPAVSAKDCVAAAGTLVQSYQLELGIWPALVA